MGARVVASSEGGGIMAYPRILGEVETLKAVVSGRSIARYGDGEFKMAKNVCGIKNHPTPNSALSRRLREILIDSGDCLVGIPNICELHRMTPDKSMFWAKHRHFSSLLTDGPYVSSLITRPDSAPWIDTPDYWAMVESLWVGHDVTLVRGSGKSLTAEDLIGARSVTEIMAPRQDAWAEYRTLMQRIGRPDRALLCIGPTATVMAVDLCAKGVHAIDLGHVGMFLRKRRRGEPLVVRDEDKILT